MGYGGGGGGGMHPQHAGMMPSHHPVPGVPYGLVPISANGGKLFHFSGKISQNKRIMEIATKHKTIESC